MRLSQVKQQAFLETLSIQHDGDFSSLGILSHQSVRLLVVFYDPDYLPQLLGNAHITCVITRPELSHLLPSGLGVGLTNQPQETFYAIHEFLAAQTSFYWQNFETEISPGCQIHEQAYVAPRNVRIGAGTIIEPKAVVLERSLIGENVRIRAGAVIGGECFEPKMLGGQKIIIHHAGGVQLGDRVEIQANSHISAAVFGGFTKIASDTKIGSLSFIAHGVEIGRRCEIANAVISGSTIIGDDVWIGPGTSISSELHIGDHAFISLGAVVMRDVPAHHRLIGIPARLMGDLTP